MIHSNSLLAGVGIAEAYADKGLIVTALPGTVLSELDRLVYGSGQNRVVDTVVALDLEQENAAYDAFAATIENVSGGTLGAGSLHDQFQDSALDTLIKAVQKHVGFAKNVVKPTVVEYAQLVRERLQVAVPPSAASLFTVETVELPELLMQIDFTELLTPYRNKPAAVPATRLNLAEKSGDELLALMQLGDKALDGCIAGWYSRKGDAWFKNIWQNFFMSENIYRSNDTYTDLRNILTVNPFDRADYGLAIYLWGRRLYDEIDSSYTQSNLAGYQALCAEWRDFGGCLIDEAQRRLTLYDQNQTLVVDTVSSRKLIRVYGTAYRAWLETGGSPEILFGLLLSGKRIFNRSGIDLEVNELKQRWHTYVLFHNASENNRLFDLFKDILSVQFETVLTHVLADEKSFIEKTPHYYDTVRAKFNCELKCLKADSLKCIDDTALKLICRSKYYYTQAEAILTDIQNAADVNPDIDVREAALLATINYVTDYVADQLTLVKE
jgi:hypothetical protein